MSRIFISPGKFVQGSKELLNLGKHISNFGSKALIVSSDADLGRTKDRIEESLKNVSVEVTYAGFSEECTKKEIERLNILSKEKNIDIVIGIGGGKALDTAKATAHYTNKPVIVVPTIASTDAPCSALAVIYTESGEFEEYLFFRNNPNMVIVDSDIIAKAPTRFLVAGMGDALATYFEARSAVASNGKNMSGGYSTKAALSLAKLCYETLLEDSIKAKAASDANVVTEALENIIEANILLSGLGFESSGLAAAHAIHNGLTVLEETHKFFHGEKVAFGTIVHLILENAPKEELETVIRYCKSVGLPTNLKDLGVEKIDERLFEVARLSTVEGETIHNMPFTVTADDVYAAILAADILGK